MAKGILSLLLASCLPVAAAHGYLFEPPARNNFSTDAGRQAKSGYCPQCGNGQGICGDGNQWPASADYVSFVQEPSRTYTAGEVVEFAVIVTAAHLGHYEFFLCDRPISADNASALACLQNWPLQRVSAVQLGIHDCEANDPREDCLPIDPNHPGRWYHDSSPRVHRIHYRIPEGLVCDHCTLQWFWATANSEPYDRVSYSCYNQLLESLGWTSNFCGWACDNTACPADYTAPTDGPRAPDPAGGSGFEEFRNCADVRVVSPPGTTIADRPGSATAAPGVVETTASPASPTTPPTELACVPAVDCGRYAWCDAVGLTQWCFARGQLLRACPAPWCEEGQLALSTTAALRLSTTMEAPEPMTPTSPSAPPAAAPTSAPTAAVAEMPTDMPTDSTTSAGPSQPATLPADMGASTPSPLATTRVAATTTTATSTATLTATSTATLTAWDPLETEESSTELPAATIIRCVANTALNTGVSDNDCARCPDGYQWWPCQGQPQGEEELCICTEVPATAGCFANPTFIFSRGVSDEACARCSSGYEWWPCNVAGLCICGGTTAPPTPPLFP